MLTEIKTNMVAAAATKWWSSQKQKHRMILEVILWVSFTAPLVLIQLPYDNIGGNLVPTVVFNNDPSFTFQSFLVSIMLAFTGAFCALMMDDSMSRVYAALTYLSMASMSSAITMLLWAIIN